MLKVCILSMQVRCRLIYSVYPDCAILRLILKYSLSSLYDLGNKYFVLQILFITETSKTHVFCYL